MLGFLMDRLRWKFNKAYWLLYCMRWKYLDGTLSVIRQLQVATSVAGVLPAAPRTPGTRNHRAVRRILFLVYWYELGGAEAYALETIKAAKSSGLQTHVLATVPSRNENYSGFSREADFIEVTDFGLSIEFVVNYVRRNAIDALHIHHSEVGYRALPRLKIANPDLFVIDSTHIVEYHRNGGFPNLSAKYSKYIDRHNVISLLLIKYIQHVYHDEYGSTIDDNKFVLTYLLKDKVPQDRLNPVNHAISNKRTVNLLFYGRIEHQKQPYMFCRLIRDLNKFSKTNQLGVIYKGIVAGSGTLTNAIKKFYSDLINRGELELCGRVDDKEHIYGLADILVLTSRNEGISLTSYEAIARGVPVISADVGAQRELLPDEMLVDIWKCNPVPEFISRIIKMMNDSEFRYVAMRHAFENYKRVSSFAISRNKILSLYQTGRE